jgi:hypothetical protein
MESYLSHQPHQRDCGEDDPPWSRDSNGDAFVLDKDKKAYWTPSDNAYPDDASYLFHEVGLATLNTVIWRSSHIMHPGLVVIGKTDGLHGGSIGMHWQWGVPLVIAYIVKDSGRRWHFIRPGHRLICWEVAELRDKRLPTPPQNLYGHFAYHWYAWEDLVRCIVNLDSYFLGCQASISLTSHHAAGQSGHQHHQK